MKVWALQAFSSRFQLPAKRLQLFKRISDKLLSRFYPLTDPLQTKFQKSPIKAITKSGK